MIAATAKGFTFQRIIPLLFVRLREPVLSELYLIESFLVDDGRVMVGNDVPFLSVFQSAPVAAHFQDGSFTNDIGTDVAFILQNPKDGMYLLFLSNVS